MSEIRFTSGRLGEDQQQIISAGFLHHTKEKKGPPYRSQRVNWLAYEARSLIGALTAELLWDWMYIDELWVDENRRGQGLGRTLMKEAEEYAVSQQLTGMWLWTQSWQASGFYERLGYREFARFADFPRGHCRIGLRKELISK